MRNRIVVIGLDGATYRVVQPLLQQSRLPVLEGLIKRGVQRELITSIPPVSTSAWVSFATGKNPGKHGVFDFTYRLPGSWQSKPADSGRTNGLTVWELLSRAGKKVGVVNIPTTYPPRPVNGFMISGFPLPAGCSDYTYPAQLATDLREQGWDLSDVATQAYSSDDFDPYLKGLYRRMTERTDAVLYLSKKYDVDVLFVHVLETDKVQHEFWKFMEWKKAGRTDTETRKYGSAIEDLFEEADRNIGRILEHFGEDSTVIVASDHGFCSSKYFVHPNVLLLEGGYLKFRRRLPTRLKLFVFRMGLTPSRMFRLVPKALQARTKEEIDSKYHKEAASGLSAMMTKRLVQAFSGLFLLTFDDVDWKSTKAYALGSSGIGQIYINSPSLSTGNVSVPEAAPDVTRDQVAASLESTTFNGSKLVEKVYRREEIYKGPFVRDAADLLVLFKDFNFTTVQTPVFSCNRAVEPNYFARGESSHDMVGILVMSGPGITNAAGRGKSDIVDVSPTILYLADVPILDSMDGNLMIDAIDPSRYRSSPPKYEAMTESPVEVKAYTKDEEDSMMDSLKRMGYI